jgi:general secretion pathway protein F
MGVYEYIALDDNGKRHKGVLEGDTPRQVRQQVRDKGWLPVAVEAIDSRSRTQAQATGSGFRGVNSTELAVLTRQLATLVASGLPIEESVRVTASQSDKTRIKRILMGVRSRLLEGHSFADALGAFPQVFPELYCSTIAAGEQTGYLDNVLLRLADYTEKRQELSRQIMLALLYPAILFAVSIGIVALLLGYVVPQVLQIFENTGQQLPLMTRMLLATSGFIHDYGLAILVAVIAAVIAGRPLLRREHIKRRLGRWWLSVPLLSRLVRDLNNARFTRTFSILSASGVPVLDGLRISAQVMGNLPMREATLHAADRVREGVSIHMALEKTGYFTPLTLRLIASGEASGKLDEMLERAAHSQEREFETVTNTLLKLFEPLLITLMALLVLFIVLAILTPIFDLNSLIR